MLHVRLRALFVEGFCVPGINNPSSSGAGASVVVPFVTGQMPFRNPRIATYKIQIREMARCQWAAQKFIPVTGTATKRRRSLITKC